jgi:glycolate oxidase FAD binding subunit
MTTTAASTVSDAPAGPFAECLVPESEDNLAVHVRDASQKQKAVYPVGGGTSLHYGLAPVKPGVGLSTARLIQVLDYPSEDLTVTVQAGITLAELNRHLAVKRQWLPIDAPESARATVGGIVATNACGPRRFGYGTIGDYLIGFNAVDGRGELFTGGGRVVKNAAGYNLPRLMVGSLGTFGVITQATFMVRPLPTHSALVICDISGFRQAECLLAALVRTQTTPMIVELLVGPPQPRCPLPAMPGTAAARLAVGFAGNAAEVQGMASALCDEWQALGADGLTTITGARVDAVWDWLSESPAVLQINVLPSRLVGLMEQIAGVLPATPLQAHAGNGVLRIYPPADAAMRCDHELAGLVQNKLRPMVVAVGGCLTVLAAPADAGLTAAEIWGPPRPGAALMRSIQQRFDPAGILNPGRLLSQGET